MEGTHWIAEHWFDLFQTVGIVASLLLAAYTAWRDECARRISNSIAINDQHRNIWNDVYEFPQLARVVDKDADVNDPPISIGEEMFVTTLVAHLSTVYRAIRFGEFVKLEGLEMDVREFFALPIPKAVWQKVKPFQDKKLVAFVEKCLQEKASTLK
jgi:hypothetical protein